MLKDKDKNSSLATLLEIFADLFKFPEEELYEDLKSGLLDEQIAELSQSAGLAILSGFENKVGTYEEMVETYNNCFLGVRTPFAVPIESVYKVWTTDESYQVPHKSQKGYLMGDSALHIKHILESLGLEIPKEYELMPDHLTILLELYAFLVSKEMEKEAEQFRKDHLDWLPDFYEALSTIDSSGFYVYTVKTLTQFIQQMIPEK